MSVDPLAEKYPNISSYAYVGNNPINAINRDGKEIIYITNGANGKPARNFTYRNGNFYDRQTEKRCDPAKESYPCMWKLLNVYRKIESSGNETLKNQLHTLEKSKLEHKVQERYINQVVAEGIGIPSEGEKTGSRFFINLSDEQKKVLEQSTGITQSDFSIVAHEMRHQYDYEIGNMSDNQPSTAKDPAEIRAVFNENIARAIEKLPKRTTYGKEKIDPKKLDNPPNNLNI